MGSFKIRGSLSRLPIAEGDDVVVFLSLLTPTLYKCYPCDTLTPISLPIFGKYDGYGGLKNIKKDENVKWIEKKLGKIEDVISAFWPTGFDSATMKELIGSKNNFHPDESIRYVYKNLLNLEIAGIHSNRMVGLIFEHKVFYKKWQMEKSRSKFKETVEKVSKLVSDTEEKVKVLTDETEKQKVLDLINYTKNWRISESLNFDGYNSLILGLYEDEADFLIEQKDNVLEMERFISYALFTHKHFEIPGTISDFVEIKDELDYLNDCIEFLKKRRKN